MLLKKSIFVVVFASAFISLNAQADWMTAPTNNGNQVLFGGNSHGQGMALICSDGDITIKYLEPDSITTVSDGKDFPGSLIIEADNSELVTRHKVIYVRHTPEHAGLAAEITNMPSTTKKLLRGIRDASDSIVLSAVYADGRSAPINLNAKKSTVSVNKFANACNIDI
jgi:hypothetical protein